VRTGRGWERRGAGGEAVELRAVHHKGRLAPWGTTYSRGGHVETGKPHVGTGRGVRGREESVQTCVSQESRPGGRGERGRERKGKQVRDGGAWQRRGGSPQAGGWREVATGAEGGEEVTHAGRVCI
jgi:hypothetical protein